LSALFSRGESEPKPTTSEGWLEAIYELQMRQQKELHRIRTGVGITTSIVLLWFLFGLIGAFIWGLALVGR